MDDPKLQAFDSALNLIRGANNIAIISHMSPDPDTIGANLALREALENLGKNVTSACIDAVPDNCLFLKNATTFVRDFAPQNFDLIITVDCGGHKLMGLQKAKPELLDRSKITLLNIDHHPSNDHFGSVNLVIDKAPATCFILFLLFTYAGWQISKDMATALLCGIYYDTGSFMHSNTTGDALRVTARLKALGANHEKCIKEQFHTASISKLKLWGRALARAELNSRKAVVSVLKDQDFNETKALHDDSSGLINYLNHVPEAKFAMLLTENQKGQIKGSLRTQNEQIDLARIAELFGGGGHKKAAGFTVQGHLVEKKIWGVV